MWFVYEWECEASIYKCIGRIQKNINLVSTQATIAMLVLYVMPDDWIELDWIEIDMFHKHRKAEKEPIQTASFWFDVAVKWSLDLIFISSSTSLLSKGRKS